MIAIGRDAQNGLPTELELELQVTADGNPYWHLSQPGGSGHIQLDRPIDGDVTAWTLMPNGAYAGVGAGPARIDTDLGGLGETANRSPQLSAPRHRPKTIQERNGNKYYYKRYKIPLPHRAGTVIAKAATQKAITAEDMREGPNNRRSGPRCHHACR